MSHTLLCRFLLLNALLAASFVAAAPAPAAPKRGYRPVAQHATPARPVLIRGLSFDRKRHTVLLSCTGLLTLSTRTVTDPMRLVVDMTHARLVSPNRELVVDDPLVKRVRIAQFSLTPPTVRLVIEPREDAEPTLAVQQTGRRIFVTVAAQAADSGDEEEAAPEGSLTPPVLPEQPSRVRVVPIEAPQPQRDPAGLQEDAPERGTIQQRLRPQRTPGQLPNAEPRIQEDGVEGWREVLPPPASQDGGAWSPAAPAVTEPEARPEPLVPDPPVTPGVPVIPPGFERRGAPSSPALPGSAPERRTPESGSETVPSGP